MADKETNALSGQEIVIQGKNEFRRSIAHLPAFYRTDTNQRFLGSTIDPLIQKGSLERLDGWVGKLDAYTRQTSDIYIPAVNDDRKAYQLDPTVTYIDQDTSSVNPEDQVKFTGTYDDYINQLKYYGAPVNNHDRLNKEVTYSWNPAVDMDKLINYREYYWLPEGPNPILIDLVGPNATTEIDVGLVTHDGSTVRAYVFGNRPTEQNPTISLYRGNTYKFTINATGHPFWIMTEPYRSGLAADGSTSTIYTSGVTNAGIESGTVTFTIPTDAPDVLYYQCGNHDAMHGILQIRTIHTGTTADTKINVAETILNNKNYSLRTLNLSNGMKIKFGTNVTDETTYANKEFYVEGVGDSITLTNVENLITPESYAKETTILYDSVAYDTRPYAKAFYRPETKDYITIKRDSRDQNAWSRYNRWFHRAVIEATGDALDYTPDLLETDRAKRPIIEFDSGLALYDHGTVAKTSITLIDTVTTDAFSSVVNQIGYIVDGIALANGMRVIFTADTDTLVKNKIYTVNFVHLSDGSTITTQDSTAVISLTEASDVTPAADESVFVEMGTLNQGKTYYYDATNEIWKTGQTKTAVNQQPLFGLWDANEVAFEDLSTYPNSTFTGAKVFNYKISSTATTDTVLGLKIKYNTINNVGDIVFESDLTAGTFRYKSGDAYFTKSLSSGHLHYTTGAYAHNNKSAWVERTNESKQRVIRTFIVNDLEKQLFPIDFYKESASITDLEIAVVVNGVKKVVTTDYTVVDGTTNKYVSFVKELAVNDQVKILGYSAQPKVDGKGIYEIAENLSINSLNSSLSEFTYGQISGHVKDVVEKNPDISGVFPGSSNLRDVPDSKLKGGTILQHTGSLVPAVFSLIDQNANFVTALEYANAEYQKFYDSFLTHAMTSAYEGVVADRVDEIITAIGQGKTNTFPFYYEDMVGWGENYSLRKYTVMDSSETEYAIDSLQDMTTPSNRAVYVYLNDVQLVLGTDYTISTTDDSINVLATIVADDIIKIRDYSDTTGSFVPPTPTKLGIYPKFKPETITDNTYLTSVSVIVGHDGSKRKAYGDYRDDLILELERRIYNNIKTAYDSTKLDPKDIIPSAFKSTEFTINEVDGVFGPDFYTWAGKNGVQYISNTTYNENNKFTWNYSYSTDVLSAEKLPGHWRGVYNYFYDTDRPHTHPWEMAGYSEKPSDWETLYGPAPYTAGNTVMWEAIAASPGRYAKPNLTNYIPVDDSGNLLDPLGAKVVKDFGLPFRNANWKFGDQAPAETAWRRSSAYPFSVTKLMALCKPAKFFGLFFDNSRLTKNISNNLVDEDTGIRQKLSTAKYHLESISSVRQMTSGYQPWIVNYLISRNLDPATFFYNKMKKLNVQLAYKLGGFTDKTNLKVLTDSVSPGSTSGSQFIPEENYKILFRTSNPVNSFYYSGILIELNTDLSIDGSTLTGGYKVLGYSTVKPYFVIYEPLRDGVHASIEVTDVRVKEYTNYQATTRTIPYGHVFATIQEVADFILGYGKYLESQGFTFDKFSGELKEVINWRNAVKEFLYWTTQGWSPGSAITVSAGAEGLSIDTDNSVVGQLKNLAGDYTILDAGGRTIDRRKISTKRIGKTFDISIKDPEVGMYNLALNTLQKEHILLFDNETVFSDILFDPITGFRQQRLKLVGWKTGNWNGDYYAPGFMFDAAQINYWVANTDYRVGDTVEYQGKFYVAKINHNSSSKFVNKSWMLKRDKPLAQLMPNFDYKIAQFNDFYDLETNNFDESQQALAQHLIGYQSRDYLENLFVNDISQYKFYQGYLRQKGSQNAIDKLLKARFEDEDINIDLYPEWMIRKGEFGNADGKENIQFKLDDTVFTANTQSIELLDNSNDVVNWARSVPVIQDNFYTKPIEYTASTTFTKYDYTTAGVDRDNVQVYKTAGYPRTTQVQHTVFNISELLNLDVNTITANDLIWIASKDNHDWDVQRVTPAGIKIASLRSINDATQLEITFTSNHDFSAGSTTTTPDNIAITNSEADELNGVYQVAAVEDYKRILINYSGSVSFLPNLVDGSTADSYGNIYKFVSVRLASMNNVNSLLSYKEYRKLNSAIDLQGDKVYADNDASSLWKVYEKQDPYTTVVRLSPDTETNQDFGWRIVARNDGRTVVASAPTKGQGTIHFFFRSDRTAGTNFTVNNSLTMTDNDDDTSKLGYSLSMSTDENFVVAGAPYANTLATDGSTRFNDSGLVKVYLWDSTAFKYNLLNTIKPPTDTSSSNESMNFGWAHKICEPGASSVRSTPTKYLFVSAPGHNSNEGVVYMYEWSIGADGSTYDTWTNCLTLESADVGTGKKFGQHLEANDNGDILAVHSVSSGQAGKVEIYRRTSQSSDDSVQHAFTLVQTLTGISADGSTLNRGFGSSLAMSKDGTTLIVGAPGADSGDQADAGAIYYYKWDADGDSTLSYTLQQTIYAPDTQTNMKFGSSIDINDAGTRLVIGAEKFSNSRDMNFDSGATTFDLQDTRIVDLNVGSGGAYTATMYNTQFVIDDRLVTTSVSPNDDFGRGVCVIDQTVFVGAPDDDGNTATDGSSKIENDGTMTVFDLTKDNTYSWKEIATESPLINNERIGSAFIFDSTSNKIIDYLDYYDPVKGRLLGIADREINIKTTWDPAVYNFGPNANTKTPWGEEHIGEVWWDLSKVKWTWYEQGDQEFKTNNWGKLFPGSSVDIYEWVETTQLPSQWNLSSKSQQGQSAGIDGTPYNIDNTEYTIKQKYSSASDSFINYYYYWVKNSAFLPRNRVVNRKNTTSYITNIITNPSGSGIKYFSITDTNKLILNNVKNSLINDIVIFNVDYKTNTLDSGPHSVWKLLKEDDKDSRPDSVIETAWWDSLIGQNSAGNRVPDMDLPINERYGTNIRPRQSWYIDRFAALKEIIDYANTILKLNQLANTIDFTNLNSEDPEPTAESLEWDASVDTYADLTYINTADLSGTLNYLVKADENINGFWAIYNWDGSTWSRTKVQTYKTPTYYSYVDWYKSGTTIETKIDKQVTYQYELDSLSIAVGSHVKVTSADTGGWKIFQYTANGWENVATQNGTIQLSTKLYDYSLDDTGFAGDDNFDENFFDQEPTLETRKVLTALRDDIFIGDLKIYYNTLFFTGLRRVLTEQTYVDWMFKTSFINVKSSVRALAQRKTYTIGRDAYVESYINEVKPFHTKLREYKLGYTATDTQDGINTDFDNPPFYDSDDGKIRSIIATRDTTKLTEYPWKMWNDYHKKHVTSITVTSGGADYSTAPTVTILGGTTGSTGPFQIYDTAASGVSAGSLGYYYPLYTSESQANIADTQNSGAGTSRQFTFTTYSGTTFYQPTSHTTYNQSTKSGLYKMYTTPDTTAATATATILDGAVTSITVTGIGANYTSTPQVVITGGGSDGLSPSNRATAYANLSNDLVRDFDMTLKFDRLDSTSSVVDWEASTSYEYNTLIRYNNELYKTTKALTSGTTFSDDNLYKFRGTERGITAANRITGMYTPTSGMPGIELSQTMSGVDYGGTIVTGLLFTEEAGWDKSGWYDFPWDIFGSSSILTWYGDGSTVSFSFPTAPVKGDVYTTYFDGTRQTAEVFNGDGSTKAFTLSTAPGSGVKVELIKFDDDKVLTPTGDRTLDSIVKGGLFDTALGVAPSDILLEGDDFISPETSYAPEEAVPGQLFDTLDIKVYTAPESGTPFITTNSWRGDDSTTTYSMGDYPGTLGSVIVTVNKQTKKLTTDYTINVKNKTITFTSAPVMNALITIRSFAISGENYRVLDVFTGDGSTVQYTTKSRLNFNLDSTDSQLYVTIDGVPSTAFTTTSSANTIIVTFSSAPAANSLIQIAGFNQASSTRAYAQIRSETVTYDGSTNRYTLTYPPGAVGPYSGLTIIEVNGKILRGPDNSYFKGDGSTMSYAVTTMTGDDSTIDPAKTITSADEIEVYKNGTKLFHITEYTVDTSAQTVTLITAPEPTDVIAITTLVNHHYYNEGNDIILRPTQITTDGYSLSASDVMTVTTFNNALGMKQRREVLQGISSGEIYLRFTPVSSDWVFVWLNGQSLIHNADYTMSGNKITIVSPAIDTADRIDVMYFASDSNRGSTGFRIFKDMLNRTFYRRISSSATTTLDQDLLPGDKTITVTDGSVLPSVDGSTLAPAVIFIDKERIEYFGKSANVLSQLRRGTLGTGIKVHRGGADVVDASSQQMVPYADTVYTNTFTGDGSTAVFSLSQTPSSASELDIFIGGQRLLLTSEDGSTINYSINDNPLISTATFVDSFSVSGQDGDVRDVKFNTDGTKMYMLGRANDKVYEYALSTGFDVSTASYTDALDISGEDTAANSIEFNTDGSKLFMLGQSEDKVHEYALSTDFDVSTGTLTTSFDISSQEAQPYGLAFNNDGTKMYVTGWLGDDINEYTLTTGFDISTASYSQLFSVSSQTAKPSAVQFNSDGTRMFVLSGADDPRIFEYRLSTAFNISTASYHEGSASLSLTSQETKPRGFCFNNDQSKLFVCGWHGDDINEYTFTTTVTLSNIPASGTQIKILHKKGQVWYTAADGNPSNGLGLQASTTAQAKFIGEEPTNAPE